jgi:hypothetical protein
MTGIGLFFRYKQQFFVQHSCVTHLYCIPLGSFARIVVAGRYVAFSAIGGLVRLTEVTARHFKSTQERPPLITSLNPPKKNPPQQEENLYIQTLKQNNHHD